MDAKKLARLFLPRTFPGVAEVKSASQGRVLDNLHSIEFYTDRIDGPMETPVITLGVIDKAALCRSLMGEAHNFFLAAIVSQGRACQVQEQNASWQAVEHYYAAYYAINYLVRLTGKSLTNMDERAKREILRLQIGTDKRDYIPTGLYVLVAVDEDAKIKLTLEKKSDKGGSHKDAWRLWDKLISDIEVETADDIEEYADLSLTLNEHMKFIRSNSNPIETRSGINYKFIGGTWIFEEKQDDVRKMQLMIEDSALHANMSSKGPRQMIINNDLVIGLAKEYFKDNATRNPKSIGSKLCNKYKRFMEPQ
ncbi:hypothetical protein GCM10011613_25430 [Cellvibrio zantedeschiae]|uniref:Uncharacterized protein n=1 Tax=Cellvibrio zantedeschiae TaxID=1237077 RepID=A0ABQ3B838_9GAMM|nr:hypothetical protein [Cellvibrio zantedeschiae]GGY79486.1 hypothetical protein GCM10011613_25430 [Cellvibrio zantedeschiae]